MPKAWKRRKIRSQRNRSQLQPDIAGKDYTSFLLGSTRKKPDSIIEKKPRSEMFFIRYKSQCNIIGMNQGMVSDPGGVNQDPTSKKEKNRIRIRPLGNNWIRKPASL